MSSPEQSSPFARRDVFVKAFILNSDGNEGKPFAHRFERNWYAPFILLGKCHVEQSTLSVEYALRRGVGEDVLQGIVGEGDKSANKQENEAHRKQDPSRSFDRPISLIPFFHVFFQPV